MIPASRRLAHACALGLGLADASIKDTFYLGGVVTLILVHDACVFFFKGVRKQTLSAALVARVGHRLRHRQEFCCLGRSRRPSSGITLPWHRGPFLGRVKCISRDAFGVGHVGFDSTARGLSSSLFAAIFASNDLASRDAHHRSFLRFDRRVTFFLGSFLRQLKSDR